MDIFDEQPEHVAAIRHIITDAFAQDDEAELVDDLRREGALAISVLAAQAQTACGHVALSRLKSPANALALAPLSVVRTRQGQGIGSALVRRGIECARTSGHDIIFVLGAPAYYERFGFTTDAAAPFQCPMPARISWRCL